MILYSVTVSVEYSIRDEWLKWMKEIHIPEVMDTGMFMDCKIWKVLVENDTGATYSIQYTLMDMSIYNMYISHHAPSLQKKHVDKFGEKAVAFRTLLQHEHHHGQS